MEGRLAVQIKLRRPPRRGAILEFDPIGMKIIAGVLRPEGRKVFDLKVSGLFEVVIVRHDIRALLSESLEGENPQRNKDQKTRPGYRSRRIAAHTRGFSMKQSDSSAEGSLGRHCAQNLSTDSVTVRTRFF
jgi:hypothetical protein